MIFLIIFALIIAAIILSIKYFIAYARLGSHKSFNKAASQQMQKMRYTDPKINCDYCGAAIDTSKYSVCPQCGAAFSNDKEWTDRFKVDQDMVDQKAEATAERAISKAQAEASRAARKLRIILIVLGSIIVGLIILGSVLMIRNGAPDYASNMELNEHRYDNYVPVDYTISGDGLIVDEDNISVRIEGIYQDDSAFKIGYIISNHSSTGIKLTMSCNAVNGYAKSFDYIYTYIKKNDEVLIYSHFYPETDIIESLVYTDIEIDTIDYEPVFVNNGEVEITTTKNIGTKPTPSEGTTLFENEYVKLIFLGEDEDNNRLYMELINKTDYLLIANCDNAQINNKPIDIYGFYKSIIPSNCILVDTYVYSYDEAYDNLTSKDQFKININVTCPDKPELNFSTGYIGGMTYSE